jgi:uncharacterized membrane protein YedE/YeeE
MGPRCSDAVHACSLALVGGVLAGFAARLARGCTSGQGLVGGGTVRGCLGIPHVHLCRRLDGRLVREKAMDLSLPLAKTGAISAATNLWLAIPIGMLFGYALFHAGLHRQPADRLGFYFKDVGVPVVMFSAIVTGMLGLWGMSLAGIIDISQVYMLPTFLVPMAVGGLLFGVGMATGGYCPGTADRGVGHRQDRRRSVHRRLSSSAA